MVTDPTDHDPGDHDPGGHDPGGQQPGEPDVADDSLAALRAELEAVDDLPVDDRVELFERANETLAAELAALDEV